MIKFIRSDNDASLYVDFYEGVIIYIRVCTKEITYSSKRIDILNKYLRSEQYKEACKILDNTD